MRILINQEPADIILESEKTLYEVYDGVRRWLGDAGYRITALSAGGMELHLTDTCAWQATSVDSVESLEFTVTLPSIIDPVRETETALLAFTSSIDEIRNVSVLLQTGRDRDAMQTVVRFTDISRRLLDLYTACRERDLPGTRTAGGDDELSRIAGSFNTMLAELVSAFDVGDTVLIGDLLEYEIAPVADRLKNYFTTVTSAGG